MKASLKEWMEHTLTLLKTLRTFANNNLISYEDVRINNVTIGSAGYVYVSSYKPAHSGILLCCLPYNFGTVSSHDAWGINANGDYIYGTGGATIDYVVIRYIYLGGYCVTQLFQGLQRFSHRSCPGVM